MKHKYLYITAFFTTALFTSCSDYLDELPDNRTELTTEESVTKILVSAYPTTTSCEIGELHSDNIDENSNLYTYLFRFERAHVSLAANYGRGTGFSTCFVD